MSRARNIAHSKPSEIDWKYGEPIAESPSEEHRRARERMVERPVVCHGRLVALRAR